MPTAENGEQRASKGSLAMRAASAAILIPAMLGSIYAGGALFSAIVAFAAIVMAFEWARMIDGRDFSPVFYALAVAGAVAFALAAADFYPLAYASCFLGAVAAAIASARTTKKPAWAAFGAVYILAPSVALIWLRADAEDGRALTLILFLIVWAADSGGYFAGRLVGGPKMSPALSPAKTWAGAVGGLVLGALAGYAAAWLIYGPEALWSYAMIGASLGLASILGDMAESGFKRTFGVKDTSGFIPGHGGALDRLDGMIFATTAMTSVLYLHMLIGRFQG